MFFDVKRAVPGPCYDQPMHISAKAEYAVRAVVELAAKAGSQPSSALSTAQDIPDRFLKSILADLKRAGILESRRGNEGGYQLALEPEKISIAYIMRAVDGQLADVHGVRPERLTYYGSAVPLQEVWIAARSALRSVLDEVTIADVVAGALPEVVTAAVKDPAAWV